MKRIAVALLLCALLLCLFSSCEKNGSAAYEPTPEEFTFTETDEQTNFVKLEMTDGSLIQMELFTQAAATTDRKYKEKVGEHY